jgi:hypothetical protein
VLPPKNLEQIPPPFRRPPSKRGRKIKNQQFLIYRIFPFFEGGRGDSRWGFSLNGIVCAAKN